MATDFRIINAALNRVGAQSITTLNDGTPGGNIAGTNYEQVVTDALTGYPWRWATKTDTLVAIDGTLPGPWTYAYQLPTDILEIRGLMVDGSPVDYERQGTKILCDVATSYDLTLTYLWRAPESIWPATFAEAITRQLEVLFLRGIGERYDEAEKREVKADRAMARAKLRDAQGSQSPRNPTISPTLRARGGSMIDPGMRTWPTWPSG